MNEEINDLIAHYEQERKQLELLIKESAEETDYKSAHLHQKALYRINNQLHLLKALKDPYYIKKNELESHISFYEKIAVGNEGIADYIQEQLQKIESKLTLLDSYKAAPFYDGTEFDDLIFDLIDQKINAFIFYLKKSNNLYLEFRLKKESLIISLPPFENIRGDIYTPKSKKNTLKAIGFKKDKTKKYFRYKYPISTFRDSISIKILVSRVIYEVFYFKELDNPTTLEIIS